MNIAAPASLFLQAYDRLLALLYPDVCQICRSQSATARESYICSACKTGRNGIQPMEPPFCDCCGLPFEGAITVTFECANCRDQQLHFRHARSAVAYTGVVKEVIHRYKYNHASWFEPLLSELLIHAAAPQIQPSDWDCIVPIPLHWAKLRGRTFNQAARLASRLSRSTNIPLNAKLLKRVQSTQTQTRLSRAERTENVKKAFAYKAKQPITGTRILLIDDVLTTGATASACAKLLKQNGAAIVDVWTVARGILK